MPIGNKKRVTSILIDIRDLLLVIFSNYDFDKKFIKVKEKRLIRLRDKIKFINQIVFSLKKIKDRKRNKLISFLIEELDEIQGDYILYREGLPIEKEFIKNTLLNIYKELKRQLLIINSSN